MKFKQLRFLLAVLEARSFTKAADIVHVAQPAIGVQIRALEDELGVKLLTRHARGVTATEAGEKLAREAAGLIAEAERIRRDIMELNSEPRGRIALGLTMTATQMLAARLAKSCLRKYPDLRLTFQEGMSFRLTDWFRQGEIDMAVTYSPPANAGAVSETLAEEPLYFVARPGHALADGTEIALRAALKADLALPPRPSELHGLLADAARAHGAALRPAHEMETVTGMVDMARRGVACTIMPYGAIRREVEAGDLAALRIVGPPLARTLYLTYPQDRSGSKAVEAVCQEIRELAAEPVANPPCRHGRGTSPPAPPGRRAPRPGPPA